VGYLPIPPAAYMSNGYSVPTILISEDEFGVFGALIKDLQRQGYLVLVARDALEATEIVRVHSRPIQLMLISGSMDGRTLASTLKKYRPGMRVLFLTSDANEVAPDLLSFDAAVVKVQQLLNPPGNQGTEVTDGRPPQDQAKSARAVA
jgi:CheY-like chemotaxis protein